MWRIEWGGAWARKDTGIEVVYQVLPGILIPWAILPTGKHSQTNYNVIVKPFPWTCDSRQAWLAEYCGVSPVRGNWWLVLGLFPMNTCKKSRTQGGSSCSPYDLTYHQVEFVTLTSFFTQIPLFHLSHVHFHAWHLPLPHACLFQFYKSKPGREVRLILGLWIIQVLKALEKKYFDTLGDANPIDVQQFSKIFTVAMYSEKTSGHSLNISLNNYQKWCSMLLKLNHLLQFIDNLHHLSPLSRPFSSVFISSPPLPPPPSSPPLIFSFPLPSTPYFFSTSPSSTQIKPLLPSRPSSEQPALTSGPGHFEFQSVA